MNILYILGTPLGYVMELIYNIIRNYGWDIILFTVLVRLVSIPLQLSSQKQMARMSAYQPLIADIQKKYKNNQEKQNEELQKLQEMGYKPMSGCLPQIVNFLVLFGVIDVVYRPLQRILHVSAASLTAAGEVLGLAANTYTRDTSILSAIIGGNADVMAVFAADEMTKINEFATHMSFFGIDMMQIPKLSFAAENLPLLVFPVLSLITMFLSTHLSMKASGQAMQGAMKISMYLMPLMFVYISFTVPVAFSLYYTVSNILMMIQSVVMRRIYDPEKMKEQVKAEIEQKRKQQKKGVKTTTVREVDDKTGQVREYSVSASEMSKRRLEYARRQDEEKYKNERTVPLDEWEARQAAAQHKTILNGEEIKGEE